MNVNLIRIGHCSFSDRVDHDRDDNRARRGIGGSPLGFEILTFIIDVRMRRIQRIECGGGKTLRVKQAVFVEGLELEWRSWLEVEWIRFWFVESTPLRFALPAS